MTVVKINVSLDTGFSGCNYRDTIEVEIPDDATPEEIQNLKEEAASDWAHNHIDIGWSDAEE